MYAIVRFYDNVHYVCSINQVYATHHITKARYRDGFRYPATIIAKNKDKKLLQTIVTNIDTKKPYVSCNRTYKELSSDKSSTQILDCNNRRSVIVPTFCGTTKHKIFNDTSANKDDTITLHKPDIDCHNIHVKTFHRNKESMNCDKMSANNDECNNETDILNQKDSCRRNVDKSLSYGDINKTINCNDEYTNNENDENDANYSNADCQRNILMPMSCISTNNIRDSNDKNTTTNETKNCSLKFNSLNSVDLLRDAHDETITTIHSNEESGGNDETGISIQDFFTEECDMMLPVIAISDINSNLYGVNVINQRDIDTESENIEVSISSAYNGCAFNNVDKCVKRLTFSTTEEPSVDAGNVCALPTCQDNTNPEIVDVSISNDNDNDEDADYTPSEHSSLDSESPQNHAPIVNQTTTSISSFDTSNTNVVGTSACNDEVMYVENSNTKSRKRYYCTFCMKPQAQLPRHLETVHRDEPEVKKFAVLSKKDPERKKIIDGIRKAGTFKFNTNPEFNTGQLIVCRRPNKKANKAATDFIACVKCKDFFAKSSIRHHSRVCIKKDFRKNKTIMIMGRQITGRIHPLANETLRKTVFPVMRDDLVTRIIRYDKLLILYGNKLCVKYKAQHQHDMIRARLRLLGRFLLVLKEINKKIEDFQSIYYPQIYDDCISAINEVAGYDNEKQLYATPAVAANLSTLIKHIGNLLVMECIKKQDEEKKKLVKDFLKLLVVDIGTSVNRTVFETQSAHKRHKKVNLPSLEDIKKLHSYLVKRRTEAYAALKEFFTYEKWISLAEVTLTAIHVFNRRRAGEIERAYIEDFENYEKVNKNMYSDIYKSLSVEDRRIAEKYVRFCIRGKLGRTVPVLLSNDLLDCIILILKYRQEAKVPKKNPYIFGLPSINKNRYRYLRACILMRKFARDCNASQSTTLRGTTLRKHIATHCIQLNLNDIDVSDLANFMGHADKIHREHYRQPQASRDILKISQYLEAVQGDEQDASNDSASDNESEKENNSRDKININTSDEADMPLSNTQNDSKICQNQVDKQGGKRKRSTSPYGKTKRLRWTDDEKEAVLQAFAQNMANHTLPSLKEIQETRKNYPCLANRTSPQIKTWLHNKQKSLPKL